MVISFDLFVFTAWYISNCASSRLTYINIIFVRDNLVLIYVQFGFNDEVGSFQENIFIHFPNKGSVVKESVMVNNPTNINKTNNYSLCNKVCQVTCAGQWLTLATPVSFESGI